MPFNYSELNIQEISRLFDEAKCDKKWDIVKAICQLDKEIRPRDANIEAVLKELKDLEQWDDVFSLELVFKEYTYEPTPGPLPKSSYTHELEELARDIMTNPLSFDVKNIDAQSIIFVNAKIYNWTTIITHADLEHIELTQQDFDLFTQFKNHGFVKSQQRSLDMESARMSLYRNTKTLLDDHPMITFQEMEAITIYTGKNDYAQINSLLRGAPISNHSPKASYYIVIAVLCASGLRKLPRSEVQDSYRAVNMNEDKISQYIKAAAQGDIVFLSGFVSTSADSVEPNFKKLPVYIHFTGGLRGVSIAPISLSPHENEILLPPTQVQLTSYQFKGGKHCFEAITCTDLQNIKTLPTERGDTWSTVAEIAAAAKQGDIDTIEQYKHEIEDITKELHNGAPLLFIAAFYGQMDAIASLMRFGGDINQPDNEGLFSISVATYFNPATILDSFVALGADVNRPNKLGQTPIFDAAAHGQIEVINKLSALNADLNRTDNRGETAIYTAIRHNQVQAVETILSLNATVANPDSKIEHCIFFAIQCDREDMLAVFLRFRVDLDVLDKEGRTPFLFAIKGGYANAARCLLTSGYITISTDLIRDMQNAYKNSHRDPNIQTLIQEVKKKLGMHQELTQQYRKKIFRDRTQDSTDAERQNADSAPKKPFT